jgi:N-acetylmuramoyl-L-alanine amidase
MRKINRLVVHCSDTPTGRDVSAADIRRWHTDPKPKGNGWKDIGYSHVVRIDGTIELGRPIEQVGSHVAGHNSDSLGICLVGRDKFSYEQYHNLCVLLKSLMAQFNLSPKDVYGHRELANGKSCPGNLDLDKLRKDIA